MVGDLAVGMRVIVPFGARKFQTGIVESFHNEKPQGYQVKDIVHIPDRKPILRHPQLKMWQWLADYYMCSLGDVMRAAMPTGLKIESETNVETNPDMDGDEAVATLNERELYTWQTLEHLGRTTPAKLATEVCSQNIMPLVGRLIDKGAVIISEKLVERFRAKMETYVRLRLPEGDTQALREAFAKVHRAPRQEHLLQTLVALSGHLHPGSKRRHVTKAELLEKSVATTPVLTALVARGFVEIYKREVSRFSYDGPQQKELPVLSEAQNKALNEVHHSFIDKNVTLLHGVTSSGKTEVYMHLIDFVLRQGRQVLYLVPEIALTTQLTHRLQTVFGHKVIIYHSRFSDNERVEIWRRLLNSSEPCLVIGARSSVFLPFARLGLVIVDEEHESSYKQFDPAPRYNGRDTAILLASMHGAKALLGSATPSVDTYYKAKNGKYGLVTLSERYAGMKLPRVEIVDMIMAHRKKEMAGPFALSTKMNLENAVKSGHQAIIFNNRRGYAPIARCWKCGFVPKCQHCDVSLTYHRRLDRLVCHYCTTQYSLPEVCPVCGFPSVEVVGYGTERVEENIEEILPDMKILRMDLDTTRNKNDYANIIDAFSNRKADILVGTQMVTKGLDFGGVSTVVVLNADALTNYPEFRSAERAFNMLEQVAGRAGRMGETGKVIIQTKAADHPIVQRVREHDYAGFYAREIEERRKYCYPPFSRIIYIYFKNEVEKQVQEIASVYADQLRQSLGSRVFGPQEPLISRIQNQYIRRIMLKIETGVSMSQIKNILKDTMVRVHSNPSFRYTTIYYDVDPY